MKAAWMRPLVAMMACAMAFASCGSPPHEGLPYYRTKELTPEWVSAGKAASAQMHRIPAFSVRNQHDRVVTQARLRGRVTLVHFFYASCGRVCPRAVGHIQHLLDTLTADSTFQVLSYTVQPERDSVAALAEYATHHQITDPRWQLLTAPRATIDDLARAGYLVNLRDGSSYGTDDLAHTETLVLVDQQARIRGVYNSTLALDIEQIARDVRTLEQVAGIQR